MNNPTVLLGGEPVPLIRRSWRSGKKLPYRKTYGLRPGQHWAEAEESAGQFEHYVELDDGSQVPVGALIAQELIDEGAETAVFSELWAGKCILVNHKLTCISHEGAIGAVLNEIRAANSGLLGGLPDVIAVFPNGRVAFREAKNVAAKDRLGRKQHEFAKLLRELYGDRLDLGVVEWGV